MTSLQSECELCALPIQVNQLTQETEAELGDFPTYRQRRNGKLGLYPTETELLHLVCMEYELGIQDSCIHACHTRKDRLLNPISSKVPILGPTDAKEIKKWCQFLNSGGGNRKWKLLALFSKNGRFLGSQHGAAFYNTVSHQLVIVHRGTELTNLESVRADNKIIQQEVGRAGYVAYSFTKQIVEEFGGGAASITVTGHSLGGWLSQVSTFYLKYPQHVDPQLLQQPTYQVSPDSVRTYGIANCAKLIKDSYHLHCISFDGPGCKEVVERLFLKYGENRKETFNVLDSLDITIYLTRLNFTNILNEQIGSVCQMKCDQIFSAEPDPKGWVATLGDLVTLKGTWEWVKRFGLSHSSSKILQFWLGCAGDGGPIGAEVLQVTDWLSPGSAWQYAKSVARNELPDYKPRDLFRFRMSCFDKSERERIRILLDCKERYKGNEKWSDYLKCAGVETITSGFELEHEDQILQIISNEDEIGRLDSGHEGNLVRELYRDYFIRKRRIALENLDISGLPPDFQESVYISQTGEYVKSLPEFRDTASGPFDIISPIFGTSCSSVVSISVPKHNTHLCTAKIYQVLSVKWLTEPVQYFVLNSQQLAKLDHIFRNSTMDPFLPNLKYVIIECVTEHDLELVQSWVDKLYDRGDSITTQIVIVHSLGVDSHISTKLESDEIRVCQVDEGQVRALRIGLNLESLIRESPVQFKLEGRRIHLNDLVPLANREFYDSLDASSLYSVLQKNSFGAMLPKLDEFQEKYYFARKFREVEIVDYCEKEMFVIVGNLGNGGFEFVRGFIRKRHSDPEQVMCQNFASFNAEVSELHKFLIVDDFTDEIRADFHERNLSGYVVELKSEREYKLIWRSSFGQPDRSKLEVADGWERECDELLQTDSDCRLKLIADEPGMGKTTIMQKLAIVFQKSGHGGRIPWTVFVPLDKAAGTIREHLGTTVSLSNVEEALAAVEACLDRDMQKVIGPFIRYVLQQELRVRIFFDGLDEVAEDVKSLVLDMVQLLRRDSKAEIHVASRKRFIAESETDNEMGVRSSKLVPELEKRFGLPCHTLKPFTLEESVDFLTKYWTNHVDFSFDATMGDELLKSYLTAFLKKFRNSIGSEADKFVGIPFQLRMMADAYMRSPFFEFYEKYAQTQEVPAEHELEPFLPEFTNLAELYKRFERAKIEQALRDKCGAIDVQREDVKGNVADLERVHELVSFDKIFSARQRRKMLGFDPGHQPPRPAAGEIVQIQAVGLILQYLPIADDELESDKSDDTEVLHRTTAEFSAAELILERILHDREKFGRIGPGLQHFLDSYLFLDRSENVFKFLNLLILHHESTPKIFRTVTDLNANLPEILEYLRARTFEVDCLDRNLMHYVIIMHQLIEEGSFADENRKPNMFLMEADYLFDRKDVFGATPFAYTFGYQKYTSGSVSPCHNLCSRVCNYNLSSICDEAFPNDRGVEYFQKECDSNKVEGFFLGIVDEVLKIQPNYLQLNNLLPTKDEVVKFILRWHSNIGEYLIRLRANFRDFFRCQITENFPVTWAVELDGESRIAFLAHAAEYATRRPSLKEFKKNLFGYLQNGNDDFEPYKRAIQALDVRGDSSLLTLFVRVGRTTVWTVDFKVKRAVFTVWESTGFLSLQRALQSTGKLKYFVPIFLALFHTLLPGECQGHVATFDRAIELWLVNLGLQQMDGGTDCAIFVAMVPILCRFFPQARFEAFIDKYKAEIKDSLTTDSIYKLQRSSAGTWDSRLHKMIVENYYASLYRTECGLKLLEQSVTNEGIDEWLSNRNPVRKMLWHYTKIWNLLTLAARAVSGTAYPRRSTN